MLHPDYPYLYETHLHTSQVSLCARNTGAEMAEACKAAGYTGIFVTDHHWGGNVGIDRHLPWEEWVDGYASGYYDAKKKGDEIGLDVFFGWEAGFAASDFLIFGLSPEWMKEHPELRSNLPYGDFEKLDDPMTVEKQFALIHEAGGMVIHAHPYREAFYIPGIKLYPEYVDGVEIINAAHSSHLSMSHNKPVYDERAKEYAKEHPEFKVTAGSDIHTTGLYCGGIAFKRKLRDSQDFVHAVMNDEDYILTNGDHWYNKAGEIID